MSIAAATCHLSAVLLYILVLRVTPSSSAAPVCDLRIREYYEEYENFKDGDVIIGGVFTVNSEVTEVTFADNPVKKIVCLRPTFRNFINILTFISSLEKLAHDDFRLVNVTFGYHIFDSCMDTRKAVKSVLQILSGPGKIIPNYSSMESNKVAGFIGDHYSVTTIPMAQILAVYGYAQLSYGATDNSLSNRQVYPQFFRTLQNDKVHYWIILNLLQRFNWTMVGIFASDDAAGETESAILIQYLKTYHMCADFIITIHLNDNKHNKNMEIVKKSSIEVIILCGSVTLAIVTTLIKEAALFRNKTLLLPPQWASSSVVNYEYIQAFHGSLGLELYGYVPQSYQYSTDIDPSKWAEDKLLEEIVILQSECLSANRTKNMFYSSLLNITLRDCAGETISANKAVLPFLSYGITPRVHHAITHLQSTVAGFLYTYMRPIRQSIANIDYRSKLNKDLKSALGITWPRTSYFDDYGEFPQHYYIFNFAYLPDGRLSIKYVGNFTPWLEDNPLTIIQKKISWKENKIPISKCLKICAPGSRRVLREACCYSCVPCSEGEISNTTDSENCRKCLDSEWPNEKKDQCIPKPVDFLSYNNDMIAVIFSYVSVSLCVIAGVVLLIFILFQNTPVVKANNRNLSFILLFSLMLSFLCVFLFLGYPESIICMLRQVSFGIIFSVSISCVLAKTIIVYVAFKATKPGNFWRKFIGVKLSNSVVMFFSSIQVLICVIWLSVSPPFQEIDTYSNKGKIIVLCNEGSVIVFYSVLGYMGFLAAVSFVSAFLARTLPDRFNEAEYITFSMLVFCSVWIAMIPAYLSSKGKDMVSVEIFAILASSAGLLFCIFFPKCYIILFTPELNSKAGFLSKRNR